MIRFAHDQCTNQTATIFNDRTKVGRSVKVKRQMLAELVRLWEAAGLDAEQLMLVFKETQWENWSFAGGRLLHT